MTGFKKRNPRSLPEERGRGRGGKTAKKTGDVFVNSQFSRKQGSCRGMGENERKHTRGLDGRTKENQKQAKTRAGKRRGGRGGEGKKKGDDPVIICVRGPATVEPKSQPWGKWRQIDRRLT